MKKVIFTIVLMALLVPFTSAMAGDASPFLSGIWTYDGGNNGFSQVDAKGFDGATHSSKHRFVNATSLAISLDVIYLGQDGTFCGCKSTTLPGSGYVQYQIWNVDLSGCEDDKGQVKAIAYQGCIGRNTAGKICPGDVLIAGFIQVDNSDVGDAGRLEFGMSAVPLNKTTKADMQALHDRCMLTLIQETDSR